MCVIKLISYTMASGYWGLVQQIGPWPANKRDMANSLNKGSIGIGGGVPGGGTKHAGHADWYSRATPAYRSSPIPAPPPMSRHTQNVIVAKQFPKFVRQPMPGSRAMLAPPPGQSYYENVPGQTPGAVGRSQADTRIITPPVLDESGR